jgi:hypothetical protein
MKKFILPALLFMGMSWAQTTIAQDFNTAGQYLDYIGKQHEDITKKYLSYNSAVSHGKRAKKVENLRAKLLDEVEAARENISSMPPFKGDKAYRDTVVSFMKFYYNVLNDDYAKIVDMQEISEQSYDEMEAYFLLKEAVDKKMKEAEDRLHYAQQRFALNNNINLIDNKSDLNQMMETVGKVNDYYDAVYLVFFKSYKEEEFLQDAIGKKNITAIEQNKNALLKYTQAGLATLDTMKSFEGDNSLITNCRSLLKFYLMEVNDKMGIISDYILKSERFDKMKNDYDNNSTHSKEDVDNFNKAVKDVNDAVNTYNSTNNQLYQKRTELIDNWNNAVNEYFDSHMPTYK